MAVYYNDNDPFVCAWLRNLIAAGQLPAGDVDERPIEEVQPSDVRPYGQAHFFAGIGGWPYALRLAGWPDDRFIWTGSCPCQPFSAAGQRRSHADARHLWPAWHRLIAECRPATIFGEQVSSALGRAWLAAVRADLEDLGYAVGAADLCAASVGAPHIRQRLWFVADTSRARLQGGIQTPHEAWEGFDAHVASGELADAQQHHHRREVQCPESERKDTERPASGPSGCGATRQLADAANNRRRQRQSPAVEARQRDAQPEYARELPRRPERLGAVSFWDAYDWLPCRDGKARPTEPTIFPLAHGIPNRLGLLRGAGNAIVPQVAAAFVRAYLETNT